MRCSIFIALALATSTSAASPYPNLEIHGISYASACVESNWKEIQELLESASKGRNTRSLLSLVRTWLCESGPSANQFVRGNAASRILVTSEQTGIIGQENSYVPSSSVQALGGNVWGVIIQYSADKVGVSYYPNEACAASGTFNYRNGKWLLTALGEACD